MVHMYKCPYAKPDRCFVYPEDQSQNFFTYKLSGLWLIFLSYLLPSIGYVIFYRPRDILRNFNRYPEEFQRVSIV